jgi:hypothetical protein
MPSVMSTLLRRHPTPVDQQVVSYSSQRGGGGGGKRCHTVAGTIGGGDDDSAIGTKDVALLARSTGVVLHSHHDARINEIPK